MDQPTNRDDGAAPETSDDPRDSFVLPSRKFAIDLCRTSLESGLILLTGDPGIGKTWLWNRLAVDRSLPWSWVPVDVTPSVEPEDFYRLLARELGLTVVEGLSTLRTSIADFLDDRRVDGERRVLVIEEAHNLSLLVWEEVRVLANRLGRRGGFSSLLLVGQTPLTRRLSTWSYASIESRLTARIHLGPIDADEAMEFLGRLHPGRVWSQVEFESYHRDGGGNPGRMLRRIGSLAIAPHRNSSPVVPTPISGPTLTSIESPQFGVQPRPPLRVEENLVEVGWQSEEALDEGDEDEALVRAEPTSTPKGEEAIQDHYAALQAWREWTKNQSPQFSTLSDRDRADAIDAAADEASEADEEPSPPSQRPNVWANEAEEPFAPFSQLFSRMAQSRSRSLES